MSKVVLDLAGCSGTEQLYVTVSQSTSMRGFVSCVNSTSVEYPNGVPSIFIKSSYGWINKTSPRKEVKA